MYKPEQYVKIKGKLCQLGYEKYTQDADHHNHDDIIALNNKFPNLTGFGFIQYLKELMAMNPACRIRWNEDTIQKMSSMMNMDASLIRTIVNYCLKELKMLRKTHIWRELEKSEEFYLIYPDFMDELINLQTKRINEETEILMRLNSKADGQLYEREIKKKKRLCAEMHEILILTPEIKKNATMFYPDINIDDFWDEFVDMCETSYIKWHALITPENYETTFYTFLNKQTAKIVIPKN